MLVAGDSAGLMRIFGNVDVTLAKKKKKIIPTKYVFMVDIRSMKSIIEWKAQPSCNAQFSFDENSIYAVDDSGEVGFFIAFIIIS